MRKGFTIIELLVASLLLGMLVTILTMIFNQSSIAWRTATALTVDMDDMRSDIASVDEQSDNAFYADNDVHYLLSVWNPNGQLRTRACDEGSETVSYRKSFVGSSFGTKATLTVADLTPATGISSAQSGGSSVKNYTVNVMSSGPDRKMDTWDDIWSYPDDPNEW